MKNKALEIGSNMGRNCNDKVQCLKNSKLKFKPRFPPTSFHHAYFVTLPEAASLAALPSIPVNSALIGCWAHIVIVTWKWKKIYYFGALAAVSGSGLGYLVDKNTPFPFFNRSEMENIRTQHLGFVIAMETICFLVTSPPVEDLLSICRSNLSQTWLSHRRKMSLHTEAGAHRGGTRCVLKDASCKWRGYSKLKTNLLESKHCPPDPSFEVAWKDVAIRVIL